MNSQTLLDAIRRRRTIKPDQLGERLVDRGIILDILESANWAPTYENTEPWRFVVFEGEGKRTLARLRARFPERQNDSDPVPDSSVMEKTRLDEADKCSHIISLGMKRHDHVPEITEIMGTACAIQNMLLIASNHGLGVKWSYGGRMYADPVLDYLGLAPEDWLFGFLLIGYPKIEWPAGERRTPIDAKVRWVGS